MSIAKFLGIFAKNPKVLKHPYSVFKYPIKNQGDLRASFAKNVKNPKWRAKTKLVPYSKKFL